jgi:predicted transglutaminase-like cysteine proteinase
MYKQLTEYYKSKGISAIDFNCPYFRYCSKTSPTTFTTAKEAFVSSGYVKHDLPRIVFISLDSGSAEKDPHLKTLESIRFWEEEKENVLMLPRNKHWYRTHELAHKILSNFKSDLQIDEARHYFAHVNSAKCCMNNPQRAQANQILFDNCREFIPGELEILDADIIITQGKWARLALDRAFPEVTASEIISETLPEMKVILINDHPVIWIETFHPRHPSFHSINRAHYPIYTAVINKFIEQKSSIMESVIWPKGSKPFNQENIKKNQPVLKKEKKMTTSARSASMFSQELTYDEIFEKIIGDLKLSLPKEILNQRPEFEHSQPNRLRIYLNKSLFSGTHYEICFRKTYNEFALHFESTPAKSLERRQSFDPFLNDISKKVGQFIKSGPLENKGWMRIWYERKKGSVNEELVERYVDEYSRFIAATYPILANVYQVNNHVNDDVQKVVVQTRSDQKVTGYKELDEYPNYPSSLTPSKADCENYTYMSMVQLCNISESLGKSRSFACNAFGGDKGKYKVSQERKARKWYGEVKVGIPVKFVLVSAVEDFFKEEGLNWK